jgi:hypothetical protein
MFSARRWYSILRLKRPAEVLRRNHLRSRSVTRRSAWRQSSLQYLAVAREEDRRAS